MINVFTHLTCIVHLLHYAAPYLCPPVHLLYRTLDETAYQKKYFIISHSKHMLWVLKRTISMKWFFCTHKTYVKTDG